MKRTISLLLLFLFITTIELIPLSLEVFSQTTFPDIRGHLFEAEILRLKNAGQLTGYPDGSFRPNLPITRAEMAVLLALANKLTIPSRTLSSTFRDVSPNHFAFPSIQAVSQSKLMQGYPDGTFKPNRQLSRAELAVILVLSKNLTSDLVGLRENAFWSNDEASIPAWAAKHLTIALFPQHQFLTYREGRMLSPAMSATRGEVAYGLHSLLFPPQETKTLNLVMNQEPDTLNNWTGFTTAMNHLLGIINLPAIGRGSGWVLYPGYLKTIPTVENGQWKITAAGKMELTYTLRDNLLWSNGKKVTIDDWSYAFAVFMDPMTPVRSRVIEDKIDLSRGSGAYGVKGFDILNPWQIRFYFKETDWRANVSPPGLGLYYKEHLEPAYQNMKNSGVIDSFVKDENLSRQPLGMGPYRITEWKPSTHIIFERNPHYLWGIPLSERIVVRFIPDTTALLAQAISGKMVDAAIMGITFDQALALEARSPQNLKVFFSPGTFLEHIALNLDNSILSDLRVRKALIFGLDREKIIREFYGNRVELAHSFLNTRHWAYNEAVLSKYSFDPDRARQLLEEAGWRIGTGGIRFKDGVRLTVELRTTSGHALREKIQAFIQQQWKNIGVEMRILNLSSTTFFSRSHYTMRAWPSMLLLSMPFEPLFMGETVWHEDQIPTEKNNWAGSNIYGYKNSEVSTALKLAEQELSESERIKLLSVVQKYVSEELPIIPINYTVGVSLYKRQLINYQPLGLGPITWNIHFWYLRQ